MRHHISDVHYHIQSVLKIFRGKKGETWRVSVGNSIFYTSTSTMSILGHFIGLSIHEGGLGSSLD